MDHVKSGCGCPLDVPDFGAFPCRFCCSMTSLPFSWLLSRCVSQALTVTSLPSSRKWNLRSRRDFCGIFDFDTKIFHNPWVFLGYEGMRGWGDDCTRSTGGLMGFGIGNPQFQFSRTFTTIQPRDSRDSAGELWLVLLPVHLCNQWIHWAKKYHRGHHDLRFTWAKYSEHHLFVGSTDG